MSHKIQRAEGMFVPPLGLLPCLDLYLVTCIKHIYLENMIRYGSQQWTIFAQYYIVVCISTKVPNVCSQSLFLLQFLIMLHGCASACSGRLLYSLPQLPFSLQLVWIVYMLLQLHDFQVDMNFMRKIPPGAEASNVLVGEVDFLEKPIIAFVRLSPAVLITGLTEVPVPTRYDNL